MYIYIYICADLSVCLSHCSLSPSFFISLPSSLFLSLCLLRHQMILKLTIPLIRSSHTCCLLPCALAGALPRQPCRGYQPQCSDEGAVPRLNQQLQRRPSFSRPDEYLKQLLFDLLESKESARSSALGPP